MCVLVLDIGNFPAKLICPQLFIVSIGFAAKSGPEGIIGNQSV